MPLLFTSPLARQGFTGADTDELDGAPLDGDGNGALAVGVLLKDPSGPTSSTLGIRSGKGVAITPPVAPGADRLARYAIQDIPGLPPAHRVELIPTYPARDSETGDCDTVGTDVLAEDDVSGADDAAIDGRSMTSGPST